jgi:hypothetical protein
LIFNDDRPGGVRRHPVAGDGPHGSGTVVDVVVEATVVDVVEVVLDDELLVVDVVLVVVDVVLLVVDVLLVEVDVLEVVVLVLVELVVDVVLVVVDEVVVLVDVLVLVVDEVLVVVDVLLVVEVVVVVEVVDDVVVVVGGPPISQFWPEIPGGQRQRYVPDSVARQVPPFRHGSFGVHGLLGSVVVVVVPAVHVDEPGGADVPGGHGVHAAAAPVENVSAGQARQAAAPSAAA